MICGRGSPTSGGKRKLSKKREAGAFFKAVQNLYHEGCVGDYEEAGHGEEYKEDSINT